MAKPKSAKPIVFFSHSAKDAIPVRRLAERFRELTHGAIELFVSSDATSIPMGQQWLSTTHEALEKCALMFVFVTPNSVGSNWIYFESGYAFAKGKQVIPIALFGLSVGSLPAPLSNFQGLTVSSVAGLNDLIYATNQKFGLTNPLGFTDDDLRDLQSTGDFGRSPVLGIHAARVDDMLLSLSFAQPTSSDDAKKAENLVTELDIKEKLEASLRELPGTLGSGWVGLVAPGARIWFSAQELWIKIDPEHAHVVLPKLEAAIQKVYPPTQDQPLAYSLKIIFEEEVEHQWDEHRVLSRLDGLGCTRGRQYRSFRLGQFDFSFSLEFDTDEYPEPPPDSPTSVEIELHAPAFTGSHLPDLLNLLFERRVLFPRKRKS
jgi:hypothetical protein